MPGLISPVDCLHLTIEIGGMPIRVNTTDADFLGLLRNRYAGFVGSSENAAVEFDIDLVTPGFVDPDADVRVTQRAGKWALERGDFRAEWEPARRTGTIRQSANPYSIDAVLRIVHTLVLAQEGGFLMHAASAIRNGKAFVFAGVSGTGKTTISRLAPADATLLTDEISYVRKNVRKDVRKDLPQFAWQDARTPPTSYVAHGTPFTGELAKLGENVSAPIAALYLLAQGPENRIDPIAPGPAVRELLANVLFFAEDLELVQRAFHAACEFVSRVPVSRLTFVPDARVWEMIG
ncbi:MAG: hypothetical protein WAN60_22495 [Candidatus Sulfotelmatobacter sp.]